MPTHDFRCTKCGATWEVFMTIDQLRRELPCSCGGVAVLTWLKAPGLGGVSEPSTRGVRPTFKPGFDVQLGRHFNTRSERDSYAKSRGLEIVGPEEWKRNADAGKRETEITRAELTEVMKDAWDQVKADEAKGKPADPLPVLDLKSNEVIIPDRSN